MVTESYDKDLFGKIMEQEIPHAVCPFVRIDKDTGKPFEFAMVILTSFEAAVAQANAEKKVRTALKDNIPSHNEAKKGYDDLYNTFIAAEILYQACRNKNNVRRYLFPNAESVLNMLNVDELGILMNHYYTTQTMFGGVVHDGELDFEATIKQLQEAGKDNRYFLSFFSVEALKTFIMYLVDQYPSSITSK